MGTPTSADLIAMYERMSLIRVFEENVGRLYREGEIPGFVHLSIGQEATAVGACWPLRPADVITSTHRGHGHCLAKGLDPFAMLAELMGKEEGVGVAFFGDGAVAQGAFHESVNLAAVWDLPVVFFCENNGYAEFTAAADQHPTSLAQRWAAYGGDHHRVDGDDVAAVSALKADVISHSRAGSGPVVVEGVTHRWSGHYEGDPKRYRPDDEVTHHRHHDDPLILHRRLLLAEGVTSEVIDGIDRATVARLERDIESARRSALPDRSSLGQFV